MPTSIHEFVKNADGSMNISRSATRSFYNSVAGIADPSVFIPPSGCKPLPPP
jgi:hypothetical protein